MLYFSPFTILLILGIIFAFYAQTKVKGNYNKYKKFQNTSGLSGAETARMILDRHGLSDVAVQPVNGNLTDHYDPRKKHVNLSKDVYYGKSVSSLSIAAHEVGHALQHAEQYAPLTLRANILPVTNFSSSAAFPLFIIGFFLNSPSLMDLGIILFSLVLLFHLVTLPVEFNASKKALVELENGIVTNNDEILGIKAVLNSAAMTYVATTLITLLHLLRFLALRNYRN